MELLKLVALDEEDLAVISTHLQDAVVRVGDLAREPLKPVRRAEEAEQFLPDVDPDVREVFLGCRLLR